MISQESLHTRHARELNKRLPNLNVIIKSARSHSPVLQKRIIDSLVSAWKQIPAKHQPSYKGIREIYIRDYQGKAPRVDLGSGLMKNRLRLQNKFDKMPSTLTYSRPRLYYHAKNCSTERKLKTSKSER